MKPQSFALKNEQVDSAWEVLPPISRYCEAGVCDETAKHVTEHIKDCAEETTHLRQGCLDKIGGFASVFDLKALKATGFKDPLLVSSTDGVGTKIQLALEHKIYDQVGQDLVAMCANDLVTRGAEPLFFQDYLATAKLDSCIAKALLDGIAQACLKSARKGRSCALVGGEIAQMPGFYQKHSWDLAGFVVGAVERACLLPQKTHQGDILIGLASDGLHANGFSLVRRILADKKPDMEQKISGKQTLKKALLKPTRLYVRSILATLDACPDGIRALAHITGGGLLANLTRVLTPGTAALVRKPSLVGIFAWVKKTHGTITDDEMLKVFNCGVGMILVVAPNKVDEVCAVLEQEGEDPEVIGHLVEQSRRSQAAFL